MDNINNLFQIVEKLKEEYSNLSKTNIDFNIFRVLRQESDEVNLHSKFIIELLSNIPFYSEKFRKLFLKNIGLDENYFKDNVRVKREYKNIDILLTEKDRAVIIENKIYAEDQGEQLARYYDIMKNNSNEVKVFYLTLEGRDPSKQSLGKKLCFEGSYEENKESIKNLSYKNNIANWIEECIKESEDVPVIRETLIQYLEVVNRLTGKTGNKDYHNSIANELLSSEKNIRLANDIKNGLEIAINNIKLQFWTELEEKIKGDKIFKTIDGKYSVEENEKYTKEKIEDNKKNYGLSYSLGKKTGNEDYELLLMFEVYGQEFYWIYGLISNGKRSRNCKEEKFEKLKKIIKEEVKNNGGNFDCYFDKSEDSCFNLVYPIPKFNYRFHDNEFFKLADKEYRENYINDIVKSVSEITESIINKIK